MREWFSILVGPSEIIPDHMGPTTRDWHDFLKNLQLSLNDAQQAISPKVLSFFSARAKVGLKEWRTNGLLSTWY